MNCPGLRRGQPAGCSGKAGKAREPAEIVPSQTPSRRRRRRRRRTARSTKVIILGVILLIIGFVTGIAILWTIGIIVVIIGVILALLGAVGHAVGGRRHYF
jgi:fatty acid desaturase